MGFVHSKHYINLGVSPASLHEIRSFVLCYNNYPHGKMVQLNLYLQLWIVCEPRIDQLCIFRVICMKAMVVLFFTLKSSGLNSNMKVYKIQILSKILPLQPYIIKQYMFYNQIETRQLVYKQLACTTPVFLLRFCVLQVRGRGWMPIGCKRTCKLILCIQLLCYQELLKEIELFRTYSYLLLNKTLSPGQ